SGRRRAGSSNVERRTLSTERDRWVKHHAPKGKDGGFVRVFVDAPCLGIGSWRRNPDAKWRSTPTDLAELIERQRAILDSAARLVKPAGRLIYVTCSLLREENEAQAEAFLDAHPDFALYPPPPPRAPGSSFSTASAPPATTTFASHPRSMAPTVSSSPSSTAISREKILFNAKDAMASQRMRRHLSRAGAFAHFAYPLRLR